MTVGLPGSGKSTWCEQQALINENSIWIARDGVRRTKKKNGEGDYFKIENETFKSFCNVISKELKLGYDVYADATNFDWESRSRLLEGLNIDLTAIRIVAVYFDIPEAKCRERNGKRAGEGYVHPEIINIICELLTPPQTDPFKYDDILIVTEKIETPL